MPTGPDYVYLSIWNAEEGGSPACAFTRKYGFLDWIKGNEDYLPYLSHWRIRSSRSEPLIANITDEINKELGHGRN